MAVLAADAALRIAQNADLYAAPESGLAHAQCRPEQFRKMLVGTVQNRPRFRPLQFLTREHPLNQILQI